jgi:hypothetical protein
VEERRGGVVGGDVSVVGFSGFVVEPHEGAAGRVRHEGTGLPAQGIVDEAVVPGGQVDDR